MPLRALLDLPLRFKVPPAFSERIDGLATSVAQAKSRDDYGAIYKSAVDLVEELVRELDGTIEQMQREGLRQDDPNDLRQRIAGAPRKEAERARTEAKTALQKAHKEWVDRTRRQLDHVTTQCMEAAATPEMTEANTDDGVKLGVESRWWKEYAAYVVTCCEEWTRNVVEKADDAYRKTVTSAVAPALQHTSQRGVASPDAASAPSVDTKISSDTPAKDVEIPTTLGALLQSVRSNVMAVGIFGTVVVVIISIAGNAFGKGTSSSSSYTMLARGGLILAVLPFSIVFGLKAAKKQRASLREKALVAHKQAIGAFVKAEVDKALERHRKTLERWLTTRGEAWANAIDKWWDGEVEQALARYEAKAIDVVRDARLSQAKFTEELGAVRAFRSQLAQNLLFDLRRRHREIAEAPPA